MFDKFKQLSELKQMRDQAMQLQRQLAAEEIEYEENGIKVVIAGDQKVRQIVIGSQNDEKLVKVINKAIEKSQQVAAKKIQSMGGMGALGGLLGK